MASGAQGATPAGAGAVSVGEFEVFPTRPLAELKSGPNLAYHAEARDQGNGEFYALVCDPAALPRVDALALRKAVDGGVGLVVPQASRVVEWPPTQRRHLVIVLDRPMGGRLVKTLEETVTPLGEEDAIRHFLTPVVTALRQMHGAGLVHGAINPTNLFFSDATKQRLVLGECASISVLSQQPVLYVPIELAMTSPTGRGAGQFADDIFGLGMTLAFLTLGRDPSRGLDEDMLLWGRIDFGSYAAILSAQRVPLAFIEVLRGMLADDPKVRWTVNEIEQWLVSRQAMTRQGMAPKRASRPFEFGGRPFFTARALAQAFNSDFAAAATAIRSNEFDSWMQRALGDEASVALLKAARAEGSGAARSEARDASLVARVGIALDFAAPIRYRDLSAMVDSIGGALAAAFVTRRSIQAIAEAVLQGVPQFLLTAKQPPHSEYITFFKSFEQLRYQLEDKRLGFGVERMLYELNRSVHCLSPLIERDCVMSVGTLLPALERQAASDFGGSFPLDRHSAAFVAARFKSATNEWIDDLSSSEPMRRLIGALRLFVRLQLLDHATPMPALARWAARQAAPIVESYHHRPTRKHLAEQMEKAVGKGNLVELLSVIDDPERVERDRLGFAEAVRAHSIVANEMKRAAEDTTNQPRQVTQLAGQLAAGLASIVACAALLASLVMLG